MLPQLGIKLFILAVNLRLAVGADLIIDMLAAVQGNHAETEVNGILHIAGILQMIPISSIS